MSQELCALPGLRLAMFLEPCLFNSPRTRLSLLLVNVQIDQLKVPVVSCDPGRRRAVRGGGCVAAGVVDASRVVDDEGPITMDRSLPDAIASASRSRVWRLTAMMATSSTG